MEQKATDGVDGGFAQDHHRRLRSIDREVAEIFLGAGRHAAPTLRSGAAQFGAHRCIFFSEQEEDRIAMTISIEFSGCNEGVRHRGCEGAVMDQVMLDRKSTRLNSSHGYISYAVFC